MKYGKKTKSQGQEISAFDVIVESSVQTIILDAKVLLDSSKPTIEKLEVKKLYDCPDHCYFVNGADIIVAAGVKGRADQLGVTVSKLAELLNKNTSTLYGYNLNQTDDMFFREFDDLVARKNPFDIICTVLPYD